VLLGLDMRFLGEKRRKKLSVAIRAMESKT
jgi:hypothetical protein